MEGFRSQFAGDEEWPATYVIVRVEPGNWMTTVELPDLVAVALREFDDKLRLIAWERRSDQLTLHLGPADVTGSTKEWLFLATRVRDRSRSAAGLSEAPDGWEWPGDVDRFQVADVQVLGREEHPNPPAVILSPMEQVLADAGSFAPDEWRELFGTDWREGEGFGMLLADPEVLVWGTPPQLAARVSDRGSLEVGTAGGFWDLPGQFVDELKEPHEVSASTPRALLESLLRDLLHRRRAAFTWCRSCGTQLAPERRHADDLCYGCASSLQGLVY